MKVYILYGFNCDYSDCGDGDGKIYFIKTYLDKHTADLAEESLTTKRQTFLTDETKWWHDNPGFYGMEKEQAAAAGSRKPVWNQTDISGENIKPDNTSFFVQEMEVE